MKVIVVASSVAYRLSMVLARKLILHSPISNGALLRPFVERCLSEGVSLLAIVGPEADKLEAEVDWIVIGDGGNPNRFLCTTAHLQEPIEDVLNMANAFDAGPDAKTEQVFL